MAWRKTTSEATTPTVTSGLPIGGTPEVVVDGVTGLIVPPRVPDALTRAITRLLRDPDLRCKMTVTDMPATVPIQIETYRRTFRQRMQRDREEREKRRQALRAVLGRLPDTLAAYPSVQETYLTNSS